MRKFPILLILIILGILVQTTNAAFTINPQQLILRVNEGERIGWMEIDNYGNEPIAVELVMYERNLDLEGNIIGGESMQKSEDFIIYPSQILLYPSQKAKSQIVLKGKEKITADKAYFLNSKEVPFKFPSEKIEQKVNVNITMKVGFQTIVALETGKRGSLSFVSSKTLDSGKVEVIVENKSGGRVSTERLYLMIDDEKINNFTGKGNSIMPGQKRRFTFYYDKPITEKEFKYGAE